ncbi:MAG: surface-adhesin E family protein [Thermodesulfobacteriota bacterium]
MNRFEAVKKLVKIDPNLTKLDHIISLIEMNCTERKRRSLWIIFYHKKGVGIENAEITLGESDWEIVLPGSAQEDILHALCE